MANFPENNNGKYRVRSISMPLRSHPSTLSLEEELTNFKTWEAGLSATPTMQAISVGLSGLAELYNCMDDHLNLQSTHQALISGQQWVDELLDGSVTLLDICSIVKDHMIQIKECVRDVQSSLRRRKGDASTEINIAHLICIRKKNKKDAKKLIIMLRRIIHKFEASTAPLQEVEQKTIYILESLLLLLSAAKVSNVKQSRWAMVSKLMNKRVVALEEKSENVNEFENVDASLCRYRSSEEGSYNEKMQNARESLEALESGIENIEIGLDGIFRRLIKTRASLLNILSQ